MIKCKSPSFFLYFFMKYVILRERKPFFFYTVLHSLQYVNYVKIVEVPTKHRQICIISTGTK